VPAAVAGGGKSAEGMREGWAGRVLDLIDSLGCSMGILAALECSHSSAAPGNCGLL
jgi:hypothetical protein